MSVSLALSYPFQSTVFPFNRWPSRSSPPTLPSQNFQQVLISYRVESKFFSLASQALPALSTHNQNFLKATICWSMNTSLASSPGPFFLLSSVWSIFSFCLCLSRAQLKVYLSREAFSGFLLPVFCFSYYLVYSLHTIWRCLFLGCMLLRGKQQIHSCSIPLKI